MGHFLTVLKFTFQSFFCDVPDIFPPASYPDTRVNIALVGTTESTRLSLLTPLASTEPPLLNLPNRGLFFVLWQVNNKVRG